MVRWMGIAAEIEPRPGGIYRLDPNGRDIIRGKYVEVVPNSRIVFTWGFEEPGHPLPSGSTRVEIDLKPDGKGTRVVLVHQELPPEIREKHAFGWAHYLERLKRVSEGTEPGPDALADLGIHHA